MNEPRCNLHLPKRPATCLKCGRRFKTEFNPPIHDECGALVRGERQVSRLCPFCRSDGTLNERRTIRRKGGENAHA